VRNQAPDKRVLALYFLARRHERMGYRVNLEPERAELTVR